MSGLLSQFDPELDYYPPSLRRKHGLKEFVPNDNLITGATSADIGWIPDFAKFRERTAARSQTDRFDDILPEGWPQLLDHPLVWSGDDLQKEKYVYDLSPSQKLEIHSALSRLKDLEIDLDDVSKSTFSLPTLGPVLEDLSSCIYQGRGFFVLRGLSPASYSREDNVIIYLGISSYIAERRGRQNLDGLMMTHITDVKFTDVPDSQRRAIHSNVAQPFHTDVICGVLALYHLNAAAKGGETLLASSWNVYNELAATRPDLIHVLARDDWVHDTFGRNPPYHQRALLHCYAKRPILIFSRRNLTGSSVTPRTPEIPPMTEAQAEALDAVHFCAMKHSLKLKLIVGDMCFINNFAVMHSRNSFEDNDQAKRYVLRLWLSNPEKGWEVPQGLQLAWDRIFEPVKEISDYWDIDPFAERGRSRMLGGEGGSSGGGGGGAGGGGKSTSCG